MLVGVSLCHTPTAGQSRKNKPVVKGMAQPVIHRETMTNERTGKTDVERGKKTKKKKQLTTIQCVQPPKLTLLFVSRGDSWGFRQACATLITCSSFRGCSSTLAAKNKVVGDIVCTEASIHLHTETHRVEQYVTVSPACYMDAYLHSCGIW